MDADSEVAVEAAMTEKRRELEELDMVAYQRHLQLTQPDKVPAHMAPALLASQLAVIQFLGCSQWLLKFTMGQWHMQ